MNSFTHKRRMTVVSLWLTVCAFLFSAPVSLLAHGSHGHSHDHSGHVHDDSEKKKKRKKKRRKKRRKKSSDVFAIDDTYKKKKKRKKRKKKRRHNHSHHKHSHTGWTFGASVGYSHSFAQEEEHEEGHQEEGQHMLTSNLLGGSHAGHSHGGGGHSHGGGGHSQEGGAYFSGNIGYQFTNNIGAGVNMSFSGEGIGDPEASLNATTKLNRRWKFNASAGLAAPLSEVSQEQNLTTRFNISGGPSYKKKRFMAGIEGRFSKSIYGQSHEEHEEEHGPTAFGDEEEHEEEHAHAKTDMSFGASISAGYRVTRKLTVSASFGVDQITALAEEHEEEHVQGGFEGHEEEEVHSGVAYMTSVEVLRATYSLGHFSVGGSFNMTSNGEGISAPDTPGIAFELSYEIH